MRRAIPACAIAVTLMAAMIPTAMHGATPTGRAIQPQTLPRLGTVDTRFQSYNVEMAEVIGGEFWKPYTAGGTVAKSTGTQSFEIGKTPGMFEARPPIDLANHRLRVLAAALGPASVRVSGTWANSVYFQDHDEPRLAKPPPGFQSVLTRAQWRGVIEFSRAVDAELVTSFAISAGVRDAAGVWTPKQATPLLDFTRQIGGTITAAELFNEPTIPRPAARRLDMMRPCSPEMRPPFGSSSKRQRRKSRLPALALSGKAASRCFQPRCRHCDPRICSTLRHNRSSIYSPIISTALSRADARR